MIGKWFVKLLTTALMLMIPAFSIYAAAVTTTTMQEQDVFYAYDAGYAQSAPTIDNNRIAATGMSETPTCVPLIQFLAAKSTSKGVQLVEDIVGPNAKATLNEAGDLVIESQNGLAKVRFDINRTVPHKNPHAHVEVFEQVKNKKVPVQKSGPIYPKDVPHE